MPRAAGLARSPGSSSWGCFLCCRCPLCCLSLVLLSLSLSFGLGLWLFGLCCPLRVLPVLPVLPVAPVLGFWCLLVLPLLPAAFFRSGGAFLSAVCLPSLVGFLGGAVGCWCLSVLGAWVCSPRSCWGLLSGLLGLAWRSVPLLGLGFLFCRLGLLLCGSGLPCPFPLLSLSRFLGGSPPSFFWLCACRQPAFCVCGKAANAERKAHGADGKPTAPTERKQSAAQKPPIPPPFPPWGKGGREPPATATGGDGGCPIGAFGFARFSSHCAPSVKPRFSRNGRGQKPRSGWKIA